MDKNKLTTFYTILCKNEKLTPLPIKFERVGKAGASLTFNPKSLEPLYMSFDMGKLHDIEYALYHELAHQICLIKYKYYGHDSKFNKVFNYLNDKYMYSDLSGMLYEQKYIMKKSELKRIIKKEIISELFAKDTDKSINSDKQLLRKAIISELDAVSLYEQFANLTSNEKIKKVFIDVAKEEKTHIGEFEALLKQIDLQYAQEKIAGKKEIS